MVLISSHRPATGTLPQVQPTNVGGTVPGITVGAVDATVTGGGARTVIFDADFSDYGSAASGIPAAAYTNRIENSWYGFDVSPPGVGFHSDVMSIAETTLNGKGAIACTWALGSGVNDRLNIRFALPATYEEGWLTYDVRFSNPFPSPKGGKLLRLYGVDPATGGTFDCDDHGWFGRTMFRELIVGDTQIILSSYNSYPGRGFPGNWYLFEGASGAVLGQTHTIEHYFKLNTTFDSTDGKIIHKLDGVEAQNRTHALYCGSESNRAGGKVESLDIGAFFGGADSTWDITGECTITFGNIKFEIPT